MCCLVFIDRQVTDAIIVFCTSPFQSRIRELTVSKLMINRMKHG